MHVCNVVFWAVGASAVEAERVVISEFNALVLVGAHDEGYVRMGVFLDDFAAQRAWLGAASALGANQAAS